MNKKHLALFLAILFMGGCSHDMFRKETGSAVGIGEIARVVCGGMKTITFAYDDGDPSNSDTAATIAQIRRNNAARAVICDPPQEHNSTSELSVHGLDIEESDALIGKRKTTIRTIGSESLK